ncbi:MAG: XRE family transcriptional regulator [Micromonosporaceae bacterium]|nr:XRE family transcriptional regulator [Micromonosporaceae bacterium]
MATPIRLKTLLRQRHWQTHRAFTIEYDRTAATIDRRLIGSGPSRAQLYRWLAGDLIGLPYPDHCRVLEAMFPGWTAEQLFAPETSAKPAPPTTATCDRSGMISKEGGDSPASQTNTDDDSHGVNYRGRETDAQAIASHQAWLRTRRLLNQHRLDLTHRVTQLYPPETRLATTGILMPPAWRLPAPVDLTSLTLAWKGQPPAPVTGRHRETLPLRPLAEPGRPYSRYSRAMRDLDRPRLFENRICYRLLDADWDNPDNGMLALGAMCYFDMIDVGEALAHELAHVAIDPDGTPRPERLTWDALPFRRMVADPFDLAAYPLMLSISTLTVRRSRAGTTFQMLRRNPAKVAIAGGMLSVMPTGVFQPASVIPAPDSPDFDLWRNMMREYSEEFLGNPEHDGDGPPIDYATTEPFRTMDAARHAGKIRVLCLGVGIDALNYVGDVLTVAIFDDDIFDEIFTGMVTHNDEGTIVTADRERREFTFDQATIERLLATEPIAPSGAACLHLAWNHHEAILA